jgi:hypothetical protein
MACADSQDVRIGVAVSQQRQGRSFIRRKTSVVAPIHDYWKATNENKEL